VPGKFLFRLPEGVECKQAHVLTAGMTAAMGLRELEKNGLTPQRGPVLVTGARRRYAIDSAPDTPGSLGRDDP
jgi:hypothetical protein